MIQYIIMIFRALSSEAIHFLAFHDFLVSRRKKIILSCVALKDKKIATHGIRSPPVRWAGVSLRSVCFANSAKVEYVPFALR